MLNTVMSDDGTCKAVDNLLRLSLDAWTAVANQCTSFWLVTPPVAGETNLTSACCMRLWAAFTFAMCFVVASLWIVSASSTFF